MNKVGIYFAYWTHSWAADFTYYAHKVARLGFDVLEICPASLVDEPRATLAAIKQAADDEGIELTHCIGFSKDKDMASPDPAIRQAGIEYANQILDVMHAMGSTVFGGIMYSSWPATMPEGVEDKRPYWDRSVASMREVSRRAEDNGITLCIEVVNRFEQYLLNSASEAAEYVDAVGSPNVKILLDMFHMNIEEDSIIGAIETAGHRLGHVHIGETNRRPPGQGRMPWDELAEGLRKIDYQGRVVMEPFIQMGGQVGRDIRIWRDLGGSPAEAELDRQAREALLFMRGKLEHAPALVLPG